jgi:hypothetical protein
LNFPRLLLLATFLLPLLGCPSEDEEPTPQPTEALRNVYARLGSESIASGNAVTGDGDIVLGFSAPVEDRSTDLFTATADGATLSDTESWNAAGTEVTIRVTEPWRAGIDYLVAARGALGGEGVNPLPGLQLPFTIAQAPLTLVGLRSAERELPLGENELRDSVALAAPLVLEFSHPVTPGAGRFTLSGSGIDPVALTVANISDKVVQLTPTVPLRDFTVYDLALAQVLGEDANREFAARTLDFFTGPATESDFPVVPDDDLLTLVQEQTFKYFWDFAEPNSGMARERNTSGRLVTSGGSGFGLMAMVVGVERGFITQQQAIERWMRVVGFLEGADRFHGAWSHWINGETGEVIPFSARDDGGDLVETAFLVQGLLTVREYLKQEAPTETDLIDRITTLWEGVEWDWYTKGDGEALYWHWSPEHEWAINLRIGGHNETQIVYTLAAASPTHPIPAEIYVSGYARDGAMRNGQTFYGIELPLGSNRGGPLFFAHYSYLGMDPRELEDDYANYWQQNIAHSLINHNYCVANPKRYYGYSEACWGLTASDGKEGYSAHAPDNDRGVITPTAALSSLPYTPEESMAALRHFYYDLGDRLWGPYGFYDAFLPDENWTADSYLAIDQGPIILMIENHRTGLLWELYMRAPEVRNGLNKLGFTY